MTRGTTWKDALGEFIPAFLSYTIPLYLALVTGFLDAVGDALSGGGHLDHRPYIDAILSIAGGGIAAGAKVIAYRFTTKRGVAHEVVH